LKDYYKFTDNTTLCAIKLFDKTMDKTVSFGEPELLPLHAMTCLCICIKIHESINKTLNYEETSKICSHMFQ